MDVIYQANIHDCSKYCILDNTRENQTSSCIGNAKADRNISVGIATRYGLEGPDIRVGARIHAPVQTGPAALSAS